ncbi:MAG: hypothetical protein ACE37J_06905 [Pikeienuella sp.]|uniref:hypothetical protein n=1 Tax=Pikeienuella sp. TaxID=2831957 RepID=UPI00391A7CDE
MIFRNRHASRLDALEAETGRQRAKAAAAAARARASLTPANLMAEAGARLGGAGHVAETVRAAPAPSLIAGFGLAWLIGAHLGRGRPAPGAPDVQPASGGEPSALGALAFIAGAMAAGASPLSPREERSAVQAADRAREGWDYGVRARGDAGSRP